MTRKLEDYLPPLKEDGVYTEKAIQTTGNLTAGGTLAVTGAATFSSTAAFSGAVNLLTNVESVNADKTVTAAMSGRMFVDVKGSATTTFTLPAAAAGLTYTFVCGDAAGEILITPATGDAIVTKTHPANDGAALAPAAGTGIKNTAATNVAGDHITLVALDGTTWYGVAQAGVWASQ